MILLNLLVALAEFIDAAGDAADVWGPVLVGLVLAAGGWRMRPRGGRHRTQSALWAPTRTTVRTVAGTVRTSLVRPAPDDQPSTPDEPPVSCADGRPASADGRPPRGGRETGGAPL